MKPDELVHRQPGQLLRTAAPAAARRWCSTTPTSSTTRRSLTLRYGFTTWQDSCDKQPFSAGHRLARVQPELRQRARPAAATCSRTSASTTCAGRRRLGRDPGALEEPVLGQRRAVEAVGQPQPEGRRRRPPDGRRAGDRQRRWAARFTFDRLFTSNNGVGGHELASVLLGAAARRARCPSTAATFEWFTKYYGAYIQDDWRVNQKLTRELRRAVRARRRPAGSREPADRRLRSRARQSARRAGAQDRRCWPAGRSTAA